MFILHVFQRWVTASGAELLESQWVQAGLGCWLDASECQSELHRELSAAFLPFPLHPRVCYGLRWVEPGP